jgi:hypothetical protein
MSGTLALRFTVFVGAPERFWVAVQFPMLKGNPMENEPSNAEQALPPEQAAAKAAFLAECGDWPKRESRL